MTSEKRPTEQIATEIEITIAKLNALAAEMPADCFVQFIIGEIQSPRQNVNGYLSVRLHTVQL